MQLRAARPFNEPSLLSKRYQRLADDKRIRVGRRHDGGLRAWLVTRHRIDLEAGRESLDDLVLHDEFFHASRLFLNIHGYDGRDPSVSEPADLLSVQRVRKKRAMKNADGEIVWFEENEG